MKSNQVKSGVLLSYASQIITLLSGLLYTPVMLRLLGQNEYGLYHLSSSVISYLGLLNFGFSSGYLRIYSRFRIKNDEKSIAGLNGLYIIVFSVIALVSLLCGIVMIVYSDALFADGLSHTEKLKIKSLMIIMLLSLIVTFYSSVFDCYLIAHRAFVFQRGLLVVKGILNPFLCLPLLLLGYGSITMALVSAVLTLMVFIFSVVYCFAKLKMRISFRHPDINLFKELSGFTIYIFLSMVVDKINLSLDNYLLGRLCGTAVVAVYGVGAQINGFYNMISSNVATIFAPKINLIVAESDDNRQLTDMFIQVSRLLFFVLSIVLCGFVFFGQLFIKIWAGPEYHESYFVALVLMVGCFVPLLQVCGIEIQKAKNMHKVRSVVYFVIAILNVLISIPLIRIMGAFGASIGTFITMILGSAFFMNYYYSKSIGLDMVRYWKAIFKLVPLLIPSIIVGVIYTLLNTDSVLIMGVMGVLFGVVYIATILFVCYKQGVKVVDYITKVK